jgi:hypothetical protein
MDEKELAAREAELVRMFSAFSNKPDPDQLRVYLEELRHYPFSVFRDAVRSALVHEQTQWAPSIGKIRSCAGHFMMVYRDEQDQLREQQEIEAGELLRLIPKKT